MSPDKENYEPELKQIRQPVYAFNLGQRISSTVGVAAVVRGAGKRVVGNLDLAIPGQSFDEEKVPEFCSLVVELGAQLNIQMSGL